MYLVIGCIFSSCDSFPLVAGAASLLCIAAKSGSENTIIFNRVIVSVLIFVYPEKSSASAFKHLFISDFLTGHHGVLLPSSTFGADEEKLHSADERSELLFQELLIKRPLTDRSQTSTTKRHKKKTQQTFVDRGPFIQHEGSK